MARPLAIAVVARAVMPLHGTSRPERAVHDFVRRMAEHSREIVERRFAWSVLIDRDVELYRELVDSGQLR